MASRTYPSREAFLAEVIRPFNARMSQPLKPILHDIRAEMCKTLEAVGIDLSGRVRQRGDAVGDLIDADPAHDVGRDLVAEHHGQHVGVAFEPVDLLGDRLPCISEHAAALPPGAADEVPPVREEDAGQDLPVR